VNEGGCAGRERILTPAGEREIEPEIADFPNPGTCGD
jgi:hypothetical protein